MTQDTHEKSIDDMTFEEAMQELEMVVRNLETGQVPLDQAIVSYERGAMLKKKCDELLGMARLKVEEIMKTSDQDFKTEASELDLIFKGKT